MADAKCLNTLHEVRLEPGIVQVFEVLELNSRTVHFWLFTQKFYQILSSPYFKN